MRNVIAILSVTLVLTICHSVQAQYGSYSRGNIHGGQDYFGPAGQPMGYSTSNIHGGHTYSNSFGQQVGQSSSNIFGGQNFSDPFGNRGYTQPNSTGGFNFHQSGQPAGYSNGNVFGGQNFHDPFGRNVGSTRPNSNGLFYNPFGW